MGVEYKWIKSSYSDYPAMFDAQSAEEFEESQQPVTLSVYDFDGQSTQEIATSVAKPFNPIWLDDSSIECNDPGGEGRIVYAISSIAETGQDQFADPFTYCAAVGTIDAPDEQYTGPEVPEEIVEALREELEMPDDAPTDWVAGGTSWRCMDGKVWACFVGANLPCYKADTSQTPSPEMEDFCGENPTSDFVPAAVTGHGMVYEWRCTDGKPEIVKQVFETDAQGFVSDFWYELSSPPEAPPTGGSQPQTEPTRIEFAPGATSAQVHSSLDPGGVRSYVLYVMGSQGMTVNLYVTTEGVPAGSAILVIWGADGTVLISDHADATTWAGELPSTQDYYIAVKSVAQDAVDYTMEVIIPPAASQPEPEAKRIQFAPDAISAQVQGSLAAGGSDRYVLSAIAGQEMTVNLSDSSAGVNAILVIWGVDGTVLISDHADATTWVGELPFTEDYYIAVKSVVQAPVDYVLEVIIPPATSGPREVPPTFQPALARLESTGVPLMLPSDFPIEEGLPPIHPYVYTAEPGEYEVSLDFGADCQGAGACHYGSLTGKKVDSSEPVGTHNFEFDAARAQKVTLTNGIEGYFIESVCGASCDDAKVFWIYNGFQYMVGLKGGPQSDVVDLANAAITNFVP